MIRYGVYTSPNKELIITKRFVLMFYDNSTVIGTKLFHDNKLIAECERDIVNSTTSYAFSDKCEAVEFDYDISNLKLTEEITITDDIVINPTVSEIGISECLRTWKLGNTLAVFDDSLFFSMNTKRIEYVVMIREMNDDIYCGASVNIPYDHGLFGGNQYFRIRNYMDNTAPFCRFYSSLGNSIITPDFEKIENTDGQCVVTNHGIYWGIKSYTDDRIVLQGCNGDEYNYYRELDKVETFI